MYIDVRILQHTKEFPLIMQFLYIAIVVNDCTCLINSASQAGFDKNCRLG